MINLHQLAPLGTQAAVLYVIATCAPALLSSRRYLQWFGVVNLVGVAIAFTIREAEFTSVWCVYAALVSVPDPRALPPPAAPGGRRVGI